jgi:hypothetical protein
MKDWVKHVVDCILAFAISFLSAIAATGMIDYKNLMIALIPSLLLGIIKFRDYWNTQLVPKKYQVKPMTIFF